MSVSVSVLASWNSSLTMHAVDANDSSSSCWLLMQQQQQQRVSEAMSRLRSSRALRDYTQA